MLGGAAFSATRRNWRSGILIHCFPGERFVGNAKVARVQRQRSAGLVFLNETRLTENEANQRRRFRNTILPSIARRAKTCSGRRTSSFRPRNTTAEAKPDTRIAASIAATIM